jgi:hypothetical protein
MGLLDSKTRILDTIITIQGRSQIAAGKLNAQFYSFTDQGAFYVQDTSTSASLDGTKRVFLEACSLPKDQITFESDDSGKLVNFRASDVLVRNGQILVQVSSALDASGSNGAGKTFLLAQDNTFASMADGLLSSSMDAYASNYIIGSPDIFDENVASFMVGNNSLQFTISDSSPIKRQNRQQANLERIDGLFVDSRLSHLPNFQYLPPINKFRPGDTTVALLGNYPNLNQKPQLTFADVEKEIEEATTLGYSSDITFEETSKTNNLICQLFEIGDNEIVKLDVIDFGIFNLTGDDISLSERKRQNKDPRNAPALSKHVFFAGKVFTDSAGVHKFVNLFTIIFEG